MLSKVSGSMFSVTGEADGLSLFNTILYGRPHGSDSTDPISSFQDRIFAFLISHCRALLASL
jgi:hypothetical protein